MKQGWISRNVLKHGISLVLRYVLCSYLSLFYLLFIAHELITGYFYITGKHRAMTEHSTKIYFMTEFCPQETHSRPVSIIILRFCYSG